MHTPQKETPTSGGNHVAGVNTQNAASIMAHGVPFGQGGADAYVHDLAQTSKARLLAKAALFASMHTKSTLWQRQMKVGSKTLALRMEWPGVLCVYDPATGEKLAQSIPGHPDTLQK